MSFKIEDFLQNHRVGAELTNPIQVMSVGTDVDVLIENGFYVVLDGINTPKGTIEESSMTPFLITTFKMRGNFSFIVQLAREVRTDKAYTRTREQYGSWLTWEEVEGFVEVIDSLTSNDGAKAGSAKQLKILNEKKVDKVEGMGLYPDTDRTKVELIPDNAGYLYKIPPFSVPSSKGEDGIPNSSFRVSNQVEASTLVARDDEGAIRVGDPKDSNHATTKEYVDYKVELSNSEMDDKIFTWRELREDKNVNLETDYGIVPIPHFSWIGSPNSDICSDPTGTLFIFPAGEGMKKQSRFDRIQLFVSFSGQTVMRISETMLGTWQDWKRVQNTEIIDNLTSTSITAGLSANQGKILKELIDNSSMIEIVNNLTSGGIDKALSAEQGKILFQNVDSGKQVVASAITDKGVPTSKEDTFSTMGNNIKNIKSGYGVGDYLGWWQLEGTDIKPAEKLEGHSDMVRAIFVDDKFIYSSSSDKTIRVVDKTSLQLEKTWSPSQERVNTIYVDDRFIYLGTYNERIIIYDKKTYKLTKTLIEYGDSINSIFVDNLFIYSGSADKTIKVWDKTTYELKQTITGHSKEVTSVYVDDRFIYSGSADKTIKVWDKTTYELKQTLTGHNNTVSSVFVDDISIYSGSFDRAIKVWDKKTYALRKTLTGHSNVIESIFVDGNFIYSNSNDRTVRIWNKINYTLEKTLEGQTSSSSLFVDEKAIYSGSYNATIEIWQMKFKIVS